ASPTPKRGPSQGDHGGGRGGRAASRPIAGTADSILVGKGAARPPAMPRPYFFPPGKTCVRSEFFRYVRRTSRHVRTTADRDDQFKLERGTRTSEPTSSFRDPGRRRVFELRLHIAATESFADRR